MAQNIYIIGGDDTYQSTALEAAAAVSATAAKLYTVLVTNTGAQQYIQVHDLAAAPTGGEVPCLSITAAANYHAGGDWFQGTKFANGIQVVNSSTAATYTAGAADCLFRVDFRKV